MFPTDSEGFRDDQLARGSSGLFEKIGWEMKTRRPRNKVRTRSTIVCAQAKIQKKGGKIPQILKERTEFVWQILL